jgi:peptide/nickel transport system substrate-binding protein
MLAVLAGLLSLPAASAAAGHRGGTFVTLATSSGGTADPQVNATQQYWQLFQVTQDGLTAFRKSSGPSANSVVADLSV